MRSGNVVRRVQGAIGVIRRFLRRQLLEKLMARFCDDKEIDAVEAARIMHYPLPLTIHRMNLGDLPFRQVGQERRVKLKDVLTLKATIDEQRLAMRELVEDSEELSQHYRL